MACNKDWQQRRVTGPPQAHSTKCHSLLTGNKPLGKLAPSLAVHTALHTGAANFSVMGERVPHEKNRTGIHSFIPAYFVVVLHLLCCGAGAAWNTGEFPESCFVRLEDVLIKLFGRNVILLLCLSGFGMKGQSR